MNDEGGMIFPVLVGIIIGYFIWGNEPAYIDNVKAQAQSDYGEAYILEKLMSGQVAVFHGFLDDFDACSKVATAFEREGGLYRCLPISQAPGGDPWWKFWKR